MAYAEQNHLRTVLTQYFSEGELRTLCFELGIDYESLGGQGKAENARELVTHAIRHGRYAELTTLVQRDRPRVALQMTDSPPQLPTAVENPRGGQPMTINVQGDYVGGDKVGGDKFNGDKIIMSGDFRGSNVNIKSTLTQVTQTIGALPQADDAAKQELQQLVAQLHEQLQQVPPENAEDAEAVAEMTKELIEKANSEKPNKRLLTITGEGLKLAAENIAAITPTVVGIATKIVALVVGLA
jgi:hypothetical protein